MKKFNFILLLLFTSKIFAQSTVISPSGASGSNIKANSNTKGMVVPRLTTKKILEITNPAKGTMVYDIDRKLLRVFSGSSWEVLKPKGTAIYPI